MHRDPLPFLYLLICLGFSSLVTFAQDKKPDQDELEQADSSEPAKETEESPEETSATEHSGSFGGQEIQYTATAGTISIARGETDPKASIFYTAYVKKDTQDPAKRPLVFCFNGGPGSSSVWLHLGGFGPKRVQMNPDGTQPAPPFQLAPNPDSILRVADLVFVDPVSTGFSRSAKADEASKFHGYEGDLESMAEFVRLYTTRNERWLSPKFLAGESYGAFRVSGLAEVLHRKYGYYLNGLILVSGVLSFDTLWGSDLAYICFLPALSEVAAYHGKLAAPLSDNAEKRRLDSAAFAKGEYASALLQGGRIAPEKKTEVAEKLSHFTGLNADLIERLNLRIPPSRFREELLRESGEMFGRFDARIKSRDSSLAGQFPEFDASYAAVLGPFSATLKDYLRRELKFESDLVYEILSSRVRPWDFSKAFEGEPIQVTDKLASVLSQNPHLKIMVNCGYHDLATPPFAIEHSLDHLKVDQNLLNNISYTYYEGGHMMYTIEESNKQWNQDVAKFITDSQ